MNTPKIQVIRTQKDGKPAVEIVVRNSMFSAELHALVGSLGYVATPDIANRRAIVCTTAEEIDAARNPLVKFFDAKGEWK